MKKNVIRTMDDLGIDQGIRGLVGQLWKHNYKTKFSCSGHNIPGESEIILFDKTGDGWFEKNADKYGLKEIKENDCCETTRKIDEKFIQEYGKRKTDFCWECGYWFNGFKRYAGTLIPEPFKQ
jgi:hypothetical protein